MFCKMTGKHIEWKANNIVIISMNCFNQSTTNGLYTVTTSFIPEQTIHIKSITTYTIYIYTPCPKKN